VHILKAEQAGVGSQFLSLVSLIQPPMTAASPPPSRAARYWPSWRSYLAICLQVDFGQWHQHSAQLSGDAI
jgi:hypothetical protein